LARKILTRDQAETAKKRAFSFLRNVLQDDDRADEVENESVDEWAEETGRTITNPEKRRNLMANGATKADLQDTIDQIGDIVVDALDPTLTREDVVAKLQEIDELINGEDDDSDDDDDDDNDDDDVTD
jgi:hypothetical protein